MSGILVFAWFMAGIIGAYLLNRYVEKYVGSIDPTNVFSVLFGPLGLIVSVWILIEAALEEEDTHGK